MKKTMIAMAVAAAMPVAAQADVTLSGSVSTSFENTSAAAKTLDIDAKLNLASTEVLANGMTATAAFGILTDSDDDTDNAGKVTLSGDFGTLTVGNKLDRDGVYSFGNIAGANQTGLYETSDSASTSNAVHYSGEMAGLSVQAQVNASTNATETAGSQDSAVQMGARYDFNGLSVGFATTDSTLDTDTTSNSKTIEEGNTSGVAYSFGDLTVAYGKDSNKDGGVTTASYATTVGAVSVSAKFVDAADDQTDFTAASASYTMDGLTLAVDYSSIKGNSSSRMITDGTKTTKMSATYVAGNMTTKVASQWDGAVDMSVALDLGNADLSISRDGEGDASDSVAKTSLKYSVAF